MTNLALLDYPKMILPKSTRGSSQRRMVLREVQTMGNEMLPVSAWIVNSENMSSLIWGKNLKRMSLVMPGLILPLGTYSTSK